MIPETEKDMIKVEKKTNRLLINSEKLLRKAWSLYSIERRLHEKQ